MEGNVWLKQEEEYLELVSKICIQLSKKYHKVYFLRKSVLARLKIPAIIIGSFTGVASFGTTTFPKETQKWVAVVVGVVNIFIATLNTLESFFKVGEEMTSAQTTYEQLRKVAEDIEKELSLPHIVRPTSGIQFLRDIYVRYQQIINSAPVLDDYISYADKETIVKPAKGLLQRIKTRLTPPSSAKGPSSPTNISVVEDIQNSDASNTLDPVDVDTNISMQIPIVANYIASASKSNIITSRSTNMTNIPTPPVQQDIETGVTTDNKP